MRQEFHGIAKNSTIPWNNEKKFHCAPTCYMYKKTKNNKQSQPQTQLKSEKGLAEEKKVIS